MRRNITLLLRLRQPFFLFPVSCLYFCVLSVLTMIPSVSPSLPFLFHVLLPLDSPLMPLVCVIVISCSFSFSFFIIFGVQNQSLSYYIQLLSLYIFLFFSSCLSALFVSFLHDLFLQPYIYLHKRILSRIMSTSLVLFPRGSCFIM